MERLAQFVSDSFDAQTSQSPPHHLSVTSSMSSSSSSSAAAAGTLSPVENVDVEAVDEDGTRSAPHLSHGIRHIILQHQQPPMKPASASRRRHHSSIVSVASNPSLGSKLLDTYKYRSQ